MSDLSFSEPNLIATLESSLRQTRNAQHRLLVRLHEVEQEAGRLRQEIEALENSAQQTENAINSLMASIRAGGANSLSLGKSVPEEPYEQRNTVRLTHSNEHYSDKLGGNPSPQRYRVSDRPQNQVLPFGDHVRSVPPVGHDIIPISQRFSDLTIPQACTLLLRESGKALHVNELYNFLVAGGYEFSGSNPTISVAVSLARNRRFRKVAPSTFDLVIRDVAQMTGND
ncbi:MAG: hypothetical protein R2684_07150 [Pyrinomonadaceae bacterium]